jgi:HK97 family phage portal protein
MGGLATFSRSSFDVVAKSFGDPMQAGFLPSLGSSVPSATGMAISQGSVFSVSTAWACVTIRSKDVARCRPRLMRLGSARSETPVTNHPVAKIFVRPNWVQTWSEFCRQMHAAYLIKNNAYAAVLRNDKGDPVALIPLNPDGVTVLEASDGSLFYQVTRIGLFQMAALRGLPLAIPEEDIFHLRGPGLNMLFGMSLTTVARDSFGVAMGLEQQAARFMANGARPSGVLQTDKQLSPVSSTRLRDQWEQLRSGIQNAGKTAILEDGVKWTAMQLSSVDLEFMSQRDYSIADIARWFDMPLYKLGVKGEMARIKFDDADQAYVNTTIMPDLDAWEEKFVQKFNLDDEDLVADFDERRLLRAAEATRINNQRLKIMSGISTQNECRAENGDPAMAGGDVLLTPVNLASSGSDMSGTAPDGAGRPDGGTLPDPGAANDEKAHRYFEVISEVRQLLDKAKTLDEAHRLISSIPHRLRRLQTAIVPYVLKDQSAFAQNLVPVTEAVRHDDL